MCVFSKFFARRQPRTPEARWARMSQAERDAFITALRQAKTANEITSLIGLPPIRGRSGPRLFY